MRGCAGSRRITLLQRPGASVTPSPEARREDRREPFAEAALALSALGLAVMPLGSDDGKVALMSGYPKWRRCPGRRAVEKWIAEHPSANIGVLCGLSRIVVVDIDAASLLEPMLDRFGDTPLIIATRRGYQLWYRACGNEQPSNLRGPEGLEVEIKAGPAAIVVVPPSWNRLSGHPYQFVRGSWQDLANLPRFDDRSRPRPGNASGDRVRSLHPNPVGTRNVSLFNYLRLNFSFASYEECEAEALWFNEVHQVEPETPGKVRTTARSVWHYMTAGGRRPAGGAYVRLSHAEIDALRATAGDVFPQALALMVDLKRQHGGRVARGEPFAISAHAMSEQRVIPGLTNRKRIEQVRRVAEEAGLLIRIRDAARELGQFSAALYTFGRVEPESEDGDVVAMKPGKKRP